MNQEECEHIDLMYVAEGMIYYCPTCKAKLARFYGSNSVPMVYEATIGLGFSVKKENSNES